MKEVFELTNPQKTIWFTQEFYAGTPIENIAGTAMIYDKIDFANFQKAINLFIKKNDNFRLKFINDNNVIKQYVDDFNNFSFDIVSVTSDTDIKRIEKNLSETPFEIFNSFLFKFKLFKFPDGHGGFVISMHHLISDAWTSGLVISQIIEIYDNLLNNIEISNEGEPSYIDYIKSENEYLTSPKFKKDKTFWNDLFSTVPEVATIPSSIIGSSKIDCKAKRKLFTIPKQTMSLINNFCKDNKISAFNFFMGIFAIYIGRVSNLDEFVIGTPLLNRSNVKEKHTGGMFISVAPLKISITQEQSFAEFCSEISSDFFSIFRHQKYSYQTLLEDLRKENSAIPNLFNVMLSYQNMRSNKQSTKTQYDSKWLFNKHISDDIEIHFFDINDTGNINIAYDFKTSRYSSEDILALHARILNMINQVLENNSILLKEMEIVTPDEKNEILYEFNNTKMDYPKDKTIVELFEEQVEKTPDNIAVVFEDKKLTYKELNEKANSLANYLINKGITEKQNIGIVVSRSVDSIVGLLALLKLNCTYVPIDPLYPQERIMHIINISKINYILFSNEKINIVNNSLIFIDISAQNYKNIDKNLTYFFNYDSNNNLYIIFTSGSTGTPKGVCLTHKNMINLIYFELNNTNIFNNHCNILQFATMSFDVSYQEIYSALLTGNSLILIADDIRKNTIKLAEHIVNNKINTLFIPPAYLKLLCLDLKVISMLQSCVTNIITAGEKLVITDGIYQLLQSGIYLHNHYGPAETHVATNFTLNSSSKLTEPPIGKAISNSAIYILDSCNQLLPINSIGQIAIAGDCVGNGYIYNDNLTKQKFIADKFLNASKLYMTGDLGYYTSDGLIHFIGRNDFQVKINGFRIELEEVERAVNLYPSIVNCVVNPLNINGRGDSLVAYYMSKNTPTVNELKQFLGQYLPNYMIPSYFVKVDNFSLTPNGKINRKSLPIPNVSHTRTIVSPRNATDNILLEIFKNLLQVSEISICDSFFNLGGDSLSAINLCAQIYNEFNIQLYVKNILEHPSVKNLSDIITSKTQEEKAVITKVQENEYYVTSSAQKRMFYSSSIAGDNSILYNISGGVILDKLPDINKLNKCLQALFVRHEALRTYFDLVDGEVVQKIDNNTNFTLDVDSNIYSEKDISTLFNQFVKPFDLKVAPLFRTKLCYLENNSCVLFVDMHHIISDGTSISIFIKELCALYNNEVLPELAITYKDFSCFEHENLKNNNLKEAEDYWVNQFKSDIPVLNLPTNYTRPAVKTYDGHKVYSIFDEETTRKINNICRELKVTPFMFLLSIYYILLSKYSSQDDIVVGSPVVGRSQAELYNIIGMFVNTLPMRAKIDSKHSFKEFLGEIKNLCLSNYKYQDYPLDELVNKLNISRDTSRNPLFDAMFIYQNNGNPSINFDGINANYYIPDTNIAKFDLSLEIIPVDNTLHLSFEYATKLFNKSFIENLSKHYSNILNAVLGDLEVEISTICMLSEGEKHKILYEFNNTKMDYPKDKTIVELFEEQVEKTPDNIAVVFEDKKLTYKELNEKANSLANYLRNAGIGRNDVVAIMVNRSLEMIVGILAVLKAGAIYILIDNSFPEERVNYILENSKAKLLITDLSCNIKIDTILNINEFHYNKNYKNSKNINTPNDNFSIIYTSGSTGNPKGVLLHHTGMTNLVYAFKDILDLKNSKKQLGFAAVSFDMFAVELFSSILLGRTLYLLNAEEIKNPVAMSTIIEENKIDFLICTPTKLELLLANPNTANCLKNLKGLQLGGEVLTTELCNKISNVCNAKIHNGYGPTEITACCSDKLITKSTEINIGTPIPNMKIYILDKDNNLCPIGVPGELCVSGVGLSSGYLYDNKKTSKVFISSNFNNETLYKTGDIALYNKNGEIEYIGRNDFQIKLNGLRIELSEIEKHISAIKEIESCVVLADKSKTFLKAFVVGQDSLSIPAIRKTLSEELPTYMVPKYIFQIDSLPITNNGKIDRSVLDAYKYTNYNNNIPYVAPETDLQKTFCKIWEEILGVKVGIDNDLFELGADSLSAIKFKVEALNVGIDVSYSNIFKYKTIRKLCSHKSEEIITTPIENFDYTNINKLLKKNKLQFNYNLKINKNNNVLLFGSNGFVGMHIIDSFIKNDTGIIYCVMRDKNGKGSLSRFLEVLHFYFGYSLDSYIGNRIIVLKGDIVKENFGLSDRSYNTIINNVSTIVNAAANVKHFGDFNKFKAINIDSIKQTIEFCKKYSKRLIHLSTLSISGNMFLDNTISKEELTNNKKIYFSEKDLFINQSLDNVYTRSKFEAEKLVLDSIPSGLNAIVLRLGNITSRYSDGKFQINPGNNAFTSRLKTFVALGIIPNSLLQSQIEFTPVDLCADSIIKCIQNKSNNVSVLHIYDRNHIKIEKILKIIKELNINIKPLKDEDFSVYIHSNLSNESIKESIKGIINDFTVNQKLSYGSNIHVKSDFSVDFLFHCKFKWPKINRQYIIRYINYLININFFN